MAGRRPWSDPACGGERHHGQRHDQRDEHRRRQRGRQGGEEAANHAFEPGEREEHHDGRCRGAHEGGQQHARPVARGHRGSKPLLDVPADGLHHHDGVVDDQPDGHRQAAERHQVQALTEAPDGKEGGRQGQGHGQRGRQPGPEVAQEERDHAHAQGDADQDGVAHGANGLVDQLGLIVDRRERDSLGQRGGGCASRGFDVGHDLGGARARQPGHAEERRLAPRPGDPQQPVLRALAHLGDGAEENGASVGSHGHRDGAQVVEPGRLARGHHGDERVRLLQAADGLEHVLRAQLFGDLRRADVQTGGALGIENHLDLPHVAPEDLHAADATYP